MATKTGWHRYGTKLRHCHPVYTNKTKTWIRHFYQITRCQTSEVLLNCNTVAVQQTQVPSTALYPHSLAMRIVLLDITGRIRNVSWSTHTTFVTGCPRRWTDRDVLATSRLATSAYWILRGAVTQPPVEERTTATSVFVCVSVCPFASISPKLLVVCVGLTVVTNKPPVAINRIKLQIQGIAPRAARRYAPPRRWQRNTINAVCYLLHRFTDIPLRIGDAKRWTLWNRNLKLPQLSPFCQSVFRSM